MKEERLNRFVAPGGVTLIEDFDPSLPYVSVAPRDGITGVYPPGYIRKYDNGIPQTYDWRRLRGSEDNTAKIWPSHEVMTLDQALGRTWDTDAMIARYVLFDRETGLPATKHPRLTKASVPWLRVQDFDVKFRVLMVDIDNPSHRVWTPEDEANYATWIATAPTLQTAITYKTRKGWRIVQALTEWYPIEELEPMAMEHMKKIAMDGIEPDWKCKDWTRYYRAPNVMREDPIRDPDDPKGKAFLKDEYGHRKVNRYRSTGAVDMTRSKPVDGHFEYPIPPAPPEEPEEETQDTSEKNAADGEAKAPREKKTPKSRKPRREGGFEYTDKLPPFYEPVIDILAHAMVPHWDKAWGWHDMYLHLGGAFLFANVPHEYVPETIYRISLRSEKLVGSKDSWADAHRDSAKDTCHRHAMGYRVSGLGSLMKDYLPIAQAFQRAMARGWKRKYYEEARGTVRAPDLEEARKQLLTIFVGAGAVDGVTCVQTTPGLGKTEQARRAAMLRAGTVEPGQRTPAGVKTAISCDKNKIAIELQSKIEADNVPAKRFRSPLSILNSEGGPECRFYDAAKAIQSGGLSVHKEFCEGRGQAPCPYKDACKAYGAFEGEENARISLGNHSLLSVLEESVGKTGLLIIDEPPSLLQSVSFSLSEIQELLRIGSVYFSSSYTDIMRPAMLALRAWVKTAPLADEKNLNAVALEEALINGSSFVSQDDILVACAAAHLPMGESNAATIIDCIQHALPDDSKTKVVPVRKTDILRARTNKSLAASIGNAAKIYQLVYTYFSERLGDHALRATLRVEEKRLNDVEERIAYITMGRRDMIDILRNHPSVVLSDANVDLHIPVIEQLLGTKDRPFKVDLRVIQARDRSRVDRYHLPIQKITRYGLMVNRKPIWQLVMKPLRLMMQWLMMPPTDSPKPKIAFIATYLPIAHALRASLLGDRQSEEMWKSLDPRPKEEREQIRARIKDVFSPFTGEWIVGHYGGLRSMNDAQHADAFVTIGDPWPPVTESLNEASFLGAEFDVRKRAEAKARAELEQAINRSRAASRTSYCRMLVVGELRPSGYGWDSSEVITLDVKHGPIPKIPDMTAEEIRFIRKTANLTQEEFARIIGIGTRSLQGYEQDRRIPIAVSVRVRKLFPDFWKG